MSVTLVGRNEPCPCKSGKKFKNCCLHKSFDGGVRQARPVPGDGAFQATLPRTPRKTSSQGTAITRVAVDYAFADAWGKAEVTYCYPVGTRIIMAGGNVLPVEYLKPGMRFRLEDGGVATVTGVEEPKTDEPASPGCDPYGKALRRVIGTVKYTGHYPRLDLGIPGEVIKTTPGHLFWSETRQAWVLAQTLRPGEFLRNERRQPVPVQWVSPIRIEYGNLHNFEVEEFHTYYVGNGPSGAIWTHNGMGMGCSVPKAAVEEALENGVINRTSKIRAAIGGIAEFAKHHIFPKEFRAWFAARGIKVDQFLVEIDRLFHEALHAGQKVLGKGGWYTRTVMNELRRAEKLLGPEEKLAASEIHRIVSDILTGLGIPTP